MVGLCCKLVHLDSLAVYWDCGIIDKSTMRDTVACADKKADFFYCKY